MIVALPRPPVDESQTLRLLVPYPVRPRSSAPLLDARLPGDRAAPGTARLFWMAWLRPSSTISCNGGLHVARLARRSVRPDEVVASARERPICRPPRRRPIRERCCNEPDSSQPRAGCRTAFHGSNRLGATQHLSQRIFQAWEISMAPTAHAMSRIRSATERSTKTWQSTDPSTRQAPVAKQVFSFVFLLTTHLQAGSATRASRQAS